MAIFLAGISKQFTEVSFQEKEKQDDKRPCEKSVYQKPFMHYEIKSNIFLYLIYSGVYLYI